MKKLLEGRLPGPQHIRARLGLGILGKRLGEPELWHVTHRSVARGVAIGLFCAFIPLPVQTLCAAALSVLLRGNLSVAVLASLWSNPLTIPLLYVLCYRLGAWLLTEPPQLSHFEFSLSGLQQLLNESWQPLLLGCTLLGVLSATLGYYGTRLIWHLYTARTWRRTRR